MPATVGLRFPFHRAEIAAVSQYQSSGDHAELRRCWSFFAQHMETC